jgi:RNA polymerase sigma-70 factor (ECF subfamily)
VTIRDPDPRTLARAREGDLAAFESLVRDYQADVWRFAVHLTRDRSMAEDVTQETFLRMFRFLRSYRSEARFTSWLLRIARNCAMDALRRQRSIDERLPPPAPPASPDMLARTEIAGAIDRLPEAQRQPFLLVEVFGLTYQEASDVLGVAVGTLKSRIHRARQTLIRSLTEDEDEDDEEGSTRAV